MDNPHGTSRITAFAFAGSSNNMDDAAGAQGANQVVCATASVDGTVKVWR
jgi:hypothetical protein